MALRWINIHFALRVAGATLATVFEMVYLYELKIPLPHIFLIFGGIQLLRLFARPLIVGLAARLGLKKSIILSTLLYAGNYAILAQVQGISWWLALFVLWSAVNHAMYWTSYHACFAALSAKGTRGEDIGAKEALVALARALAPAASGFAIAYVGFTTSFFLAGSLVILSAIPLFFLPPVPAVPLVSWRETWRTSDRRGFLVHFGHGWYEAGILTWSLIVFLLVADYAVAGGLASLVVIFQMIAFLFVGKFIDRGHGYLIAHIAIGLLAVVMLGRAGFVRDIPTTILFDAIYAIANCFYGPALDTILYNAAGDAKNAWGFQVLSETSVDAGYVLSWTFGAIVTYFGLGLQWMLVWSLGGMLIMLFVFRNYYART